MPSSMRLIRGVYNIPEFPQGSVVTLGAFDGIHLGHQAIIRQVVDRAKQLALPSVLICFEPLPREFFAPDNVLLRILSFRDKCRVLKNLGIDAVLVIHFNHKVASLSAEDFFEQVFVQGLNMRYLVVGDDFRFGSNRGGDKKMFLEYSETHGFGFSQTESVVHDGERVSSTLIRECLERGKFKRVSELLGRPYSISGRFVAAELPYQQTLAADTVSILCHSMLCGPHLVRLTLANQQQCFAVIQPESETERSGINRKHRFTSILLGEVEISPERDIEIEFLCRLSENQHHSTRNNRSEISQYNVAEARQWVTDNMSG